MRLSHTLIALTLGLASTCLAAPATLTRAEVPSQYPQCPAIQEVTHQVEKNIGHGQTPLTQETKVSKDACNHCDQSSQPYIKRRGTTRANKEDLTQQGHRQQVTAKSCSHGKTAHTTRNPTRKPQTKNTKVVVFRRQLPASSILYYRHRRLEKNWLEIRRQLLWEYLLALKEDLAVEASKRGHGYELKRGNYRIEPGTMLTVLI